MKCKKGYEVKPIKSAAGWYVGTLDPEGFPNCRITTKYAKSEELAKILILDRQIGCVENEFCNGGMGCFSLDNYYDEYHQKLLKLVQNMFDFSTGGDNNDN